jgi:hypothetical protein
MLSMACGIDLGNVVMEMIEKNQVEDFKTNKCTNVSII